MKDVDNAINLSFKNSAQVKEGVPCGCYFCMAVFDGGEVTKWADSGETALCPYCAVDSVLPNETNEEFLIAACERWFTGKGEENGLV